MGLASSTYGMDMGRAANTVGSKFCPEPALDMPAEHGTYCISMRRHTAGLLRDSWICPSTFVMGVAASGSPARLLLPAAAARARPHPAGSLPLPRPVSPPSGPRRIAGGHRRAWVRAVAAELDMDPHALLMQVLRGAAPRQ